MPLVRVVADISDLTGPNAPQARIEAEKDKILRGAGVRVSKMIRQWIRDLGANRHNTADRLGATPTNHYKASDVSPPVVFDNEVTINISTPGISRAFGDLHIFPVEADMLAIPMHRDAYGLQPREMTDRGERLFRILRRGEHRGGNLYNILFRRGERGGLEAMYALTNAVHQPQDRSLLPSNEQLETEFATGVRQAVKAVLQE